MFRLPQKFSNEITPSLLKGRWFKKSPLAAESADGSLHLVFLFQKAVLTIGRFHTRIGQSGRQGKRR